MQQIKKVNKPRRAPQKAILKKMMREEERDVAKVEKQYHANEMAYMGASVPAKQGPKKKVWRPKLLRVRAGQAQNIPSKLPAPITRLTLNPQSASSARGGGGVGIDPGAIFSSALRLKHRWTSAVYNGIAEGDCRYPDPFTLAKTSILQTRSCVDFAPSDITSMSSSTYNGILYGVVKGSGVNTFGLSPTKAYADTSTATPWDGGNLAWTSTSAGTSSQLTRPNGMVLSIKPLLRGVEHSVTINAFPIAPITASAIPAQPTGWPATVLDMLRGITSVQSSWGGRQWTFNNSDESVNLVTLPIDARCLDFAVGNLERTGHTSTASLSWTGWVFWISGLQPALDMVHISCNAVEELVNIGQTAIAYAYPANVRRPNINLAENSVNEAVDLANAGLAAAKWTSILWEGAKRLGGYALDALLKNEGLLGDFTEKTLSNCWLMSDSYSKESMNRRQPIMDHSTHEEEKCAQKTPDIEDLPLGTLSSATRTVNALTDEPEIVTPKGARRPSIALSLSGRRK